MVCAYHDVAPGHGSDVVFPNAGGLRIGRGRAALVARIEALRDRWSALGEVRVEQAERHTHDDLRSSCCEESKKRVEL